MHDLPLVTTVAVAFTAAWLLGIITQKLGLSPIVGYLLAGIAIGRYTPGFVADENLAHQLAEIGVILLMFGVGLHFHLKDLFAVKSVAIPGAIGQSLIATLVGLAAFHAFGMPPATAAVIGMAIAVASTVVLMRVLMDADVLNSPQGHIAVGWLLVEDIFTVIVLVLIPTFAPAGQPVADAGAQAADVAASGLFAAVGIALLKLAILVAIVILVGARVVPWVLVQVARLRSRELFTLTVLVFSISMAAASYAVFGASMALGAFLAGMMVALSPASAQAAADALPMRDAFAVIFFVSVGMLFDPSFLIHEPWMILTALGIILIIKPLSALLIVALLGRSVRTALTVALGLAQIGEFSFILSELARAHHLMPDSGHSVLIASAIISITINPLLFRLRIPLENWLRSKPKLWALLNGRADRRARAVNSQVSQQVAAHAASDKPLAVVVGFGPVGRAVHRLLTDAGLVTVVIDLNMDTISELQSEGQAAIFGDASREAILEEAGMPKAAYLVLTLPDASARSAVVIAAKNLNPSARVFVRARYLQERADLERAGATSAVFEEEEAAVALARLVLADTGAHRDVVAKKVRDLRLQLISENMSKIRSQRIRTIMVPWSRVRQLSTGDTREDVFRKFAEQRFSRWPVTDAKSGKVAGYLLAKDLIGDAMGGGEWVRLVRPVRMIHSDDLVESTLEQMQSEGISMSVVEEAGNPVGIVTLEDILEQVLGRIEDEYPRESHVRLRDAVETGGFVLDMQSASGEEAIAELAAAIRSELLPEGANIAELAIERERTASTDVGSGVAMPHARCAGLESPLVVFGHSKSGILFSPTSTELVRLTFLLVTPEEQPDLQLSLLAQLSRIASNYVAREQLLRATNEIEVIEILSNDYAFSHLEPEE
jgi:CPA2 family monovalent cation:H+ antiporter-2